MNPSLDRPRAPGPTAALGLVVLTLATVLSAGSGGGWTVLGLVVGCAVGALIAWTAGAFRLVVRRGVFDWSVRGLLVASGALVLLAPGSPLGWAALAAAIIISFGARPNHELTMDFGAGLAWSDGQSRRSWAALSALGCTAMTLVGLSQSRHPEMLFSARAALIVTSALCWACLLQFRPARQPLRTARHLALLVLPAASLWPPGPYLPVILGAYLMSWMWLEFAMLPRLGDASDLEDPRIPRQPTPSAGLVLKVWHVGAIFGVAALIAWGVVWAIY